MIGRFRFSLWSTMAVLVSVAILATLGTWQLQRRTWKLDLIAAVEARAGGTPQPLATVIGDFEAGRDARYSAVSIRGQFHHTDEIHVFGTIGPAPGYFIFTPFFPDIGTAASQPFYVNRGFVPQDLKQPDKRADGQIGGIVTITGLFREAEVKPVFARALSPQNDPLKNIWYNRNPADFAKDGAATRWYIDSSGSENTAPYPKGGSTRIDFTNNHLDYALTWYGLALALIGVWLVFSRRR